MRHAISLDGLYEELQRHGIALPTTRLLELAKAGYLPCFYVDRLGPFFHKKETLDWIEAHLMHHNEPKSFPEELRAVHNVNSVPVCVPQPLLPLQQHVRELSLAVMEYPPCIYFLVRDGAVVYVGQSVSLVGRISDHMRGKVFDRIFYLPVPEADLMNVERAFIMFFQAEYNSEGFAGKPLSENEREILKPYFWGQPTQREASNGADK